MATASQSLRPLAVCSRCLKAQGVFKLPLRSLSTAASRSAAAAPEAANPAQLPPLIPTEQLDPNTVKSVSEESRLLKHRGLTPIGSRRRRVAMASIENAVPFEQQPYQAFQEARKYLAEDRQEKIAAIEKLRTRIKTIEAQDAAVSGGEPAKQHRLKSMQRRIEELKILADINDPMVKKRFEDGLGNMDKPIYRFLADRKWRQMKRKVLVQRLTQMSVVPDVLPEVDPLLDIDILWNNRIISPGDFVPSSTSAIAPSLRIQKFDKGEGTYTIVAVDSDVPDPDNDTFTARCHGIWQNVKASPSNPEVGQLVDSNAGIKAIVPWSVPFAHKGSPYHRISLFIFEQPEGKQLNAEQIRILTRKENSANMWLRGFMSLAGLKPVGATMFRIEWDATMAAVMQQNNIPGADIEFRRKKPERLPEKYRVKNGLRYRGWRR